MTPTSFATTRLVRAPRERVFAAWTTPDSLKKWWGPGPVTCPEAHIDLREGGAYRIANTEIDGSIIWISGEFEEVKAPERLVYTWNVSAVPGAATLVTIEFRVHPDGTEIALRHDRFTDEAIRAMHGEGWEAILDKLVPALEGPGHS